MSSNNKIEGERIRDREYRLDDSVAGIEVIACGKPIKLWSLCYGFGEFAGWASILPMVGILIGWMCVTWKLDRDKKRLEKEVSRLVRRVSGESGEIESDRGGRSEGSDRRELREKELKNQERVIKMFEMAEESLRSTTDPSDLEEYGRCIISADREAFRCYTQNAFSGEVFRRHFGKRRRDIQNKREEGLKLVPSLTFQFERDYRRLVTEDFVHINEPEFREFIDLLMNAAEQGITEDRAIKYAERMREEYLGDTL